MAIIPIRLWILGLCLRREGRIIRHWELLTGGGRASRIGKITSSSSNWEKGVFRRIAD